MSFRRENSTVAYSLAVASLIALLAFAAPALSSTGRTPTPKKPRAVTGGVKDFHTFSGTLDATVDPEGLPTTYYFEYGPTTTYGSKSTPVAVGSGFTPVKVGQIVNGLLGGWHYRVLATNADGQTIGKDRVITEASKRLKFTFPIKAKSHDRLTGYEGTYVLSGTLTGSGGGNHAVELQANPYPFKVGFAPVGPVVSTGPSGAFSFRIAKMTENTEFRVVAPGPRALNSASMTVYVAVNVTIHVHSISHAGLARVYGTVAPATAGQVVVEILKPAKEDSRREASGPRAQPVGASKLKRATSALSRFSTVVSLPSTGYYRVYVRLAKGGPLVSGYSRDILIRTSKPAKSKAKAKAKKKA